MFYFCGEGVNSVSGCCLACFVYSTAMDSFCIEPPNQYTLHFHWKSLLQEWETNLMDLMLSSAFHSLGSSISLKAKGCNLVTRGMRKVFLGGARRPFRALCCCGCLAGTLV